MKSSRPFSSKSSQSAESYKPQSYYELFPQTLSAGTPPQGPFHIDPSKLRREFLQLQAKAHPDRHPQAAKVKAEATSAFINEAYKTLLSPLQRAQYLLSLRGLDVADDESAKTDDSELLMVVLEAREEIEEAEEEEQLKPLKMANDARIKESLEVLERAFREDDLTTAKMEAIKLKYWTNIKESIDAWERGKPVILVH